MSELFTEANRKRMVSTFIDLVKIDSLGKKEGKVAARLEKIFRETGCSVQFDGAGRKVGGETGNLIAKFPGTCKCEPFLLSSHMDTVDPGEGIKPVIGRDRITSDGTTILGADCKSGLAVIIEVLRILKENNLPCPPIEVVCTICEETGMHGSKNLDYSKIKAKSGIVLDSDSPEEVTIKAPSADRINIDIHGLSAHAGVCPERGISAITVAAKAIAGMKLGRIDFETTANIGIVSGGIATNIVTDFLNIKAEARSHKIAKLDRQTKHMRDQFEKAIKASALKLDGKIVRPSMDWTITRSYPNLVIDAKNPVLLALKKAAKLEKMNVKFAPSGGGSDANIFYGHGLQTPNVGCGMHEAHTTREYLLLKDFFDCARLTLSTVSLFAGKKD